MVFKFLDADNSGKMSKAELTNAMSMMGMQTSAGAIANMMKDTDTDKDGLVSLDEYLGMMGAK